MGLFYKYMFLVPMLKIDSNYWEKGEKADSFNERIKVNDVKIISSHFYGLVNEVNYFSIFF